jgi:hypothetical protein
MMGIKNALTVPPAANGPQTSGLFDIAMINAPLQKSGWPQTVQSTLRNAILQ